MPNNNHIYSQLVEAINSSIPCMLASVIHTQNSTSATVGDKALVGVDGKISGWIGGGCCQSVVQKLVPQLLKENKHCVIRVCPEQAFIEGMNCYPSHCPSEGTVDIFLEPIANQQAVYLYGNTPTAQSIARYSEELGIDLKWRQSPDQLPKNMSNSNANIAIIATQGKGDFAALQQVLTDKVEHVLLIASSKKALALKDKLKNSGACANTVDKITAPAGIDIGATSGPEIALSVMAKVVSLRCNNPSDLSLTQQQLTENQAQEEAQEKVKEKTQNIDTNSASKASSSCCGGA